MTFDIGGGRQLTSSPCTLALLPERFAKSAPAERTGVCGVRWRYRPLVCATAGSVDDGKSTLIGRLLYDCKALMTDQLEHVTEVSKRRGLDRTDLALLTDGLRAEREQGITIDVAWRYFSTPKRRFILADSPGHVQYTRNMVTAASHADVAVVLVDARRGLTEQTRRHLFVARLLGVLGITIAINKMDQVGFALDVFARLRDEACSYLEAVDLPRGAPRVSVLPISALHGDNVVDWSAAMPWYDGATLLAHLENHPKAAESISAGARLAVQTVLRPQSALHPDFRGYAGRVASGSPRGRCRRRLRGLAGRRRHAGSSGDQGASGRRLAWMSAAAGLAGASYVLKCGTREVRASLERIEARYDVASGQATPAEDRDSSVALNDLARVHLRTHAPVVVDAYRDAPPSGSFLLVTRSRRRPSRPGWSADPRSCAA